MFGAGSPVADDGKTAQIPDYIAEPARSGSTTASGRITSSRTRTGRTATCSMQEANSPVGNLAMDHGPHAGSRAASHRPRPPSPSTSASRPPRPTTGRHGAKLHADTFSILKTHQGARRGLQGPDRHGRVVELLTIYGALPADPAKQQAFFDSINANFPDIELDWSVPQAMLGYPDMPNHQAYVPNYAEAKAAFQAFQNKYRTTPGLDMDAELAALKIDPPGDLRRARPAEAIGSLLHGPLGFPRPEGAYHQHRWSRSCHDRDDRGSLPHPSPPPAGRIGSRRRPAARRSGATSSSVRGSSGWRCSSVGPIVASLIISLTDFDLVRPEDVKFIGLDNYVRHGVRPERRAIAARHVQVRPHRHPPDDDRQPRPRAAREQPEALRTERLPDAPLHADPDPAGGQHAGVDRLPEHRDRLAERPHRGRRPDRTRLDQQRGLDLPGARADRPVGHRQLHAHQHRRPAVASRPSCTRRRGSTAPAPGRRSGGSRSR